MTVDGGNETPELRTPLDAFDTLRQVNAHLRSALIHMQPERNHCSAITPQDFSNLRNQIQQGAECVSGLGADTTTAAQKEAGAYRSHLENLQEFLPDLHGRLVHVMAADPGVKVHLYGKAVRPGRKIGHVTALGDDVEDLRDRARRAASYLRHGTEQEQPDG